MVSAGVLYGSSDMATPFIVGGKSLASHLKEVIVSLVGSGSETQHPKPFGELPEIFSNPITMGNFRKYSREELNER